MHKYIVAGIDTDVGKTVVSAILCKALQADYWKPVQCGCDGSSDKETVSDLIGNSSLTQFDPSYKLKAPVSPHYAAELENSAIDTKTISMPHSHRSLVIECAGGLCVPYTDYELQVDLFSQWNCRWILVSKHYIGSINHSLLALEALKVRRQHISGIIFNGNIYESGERLILRHAHAPLLGRLLPEEKISHTVVNKYAKEWKENLLCHL